MDEFGDHYFGNDDTDLDDAIEAADAKPFVYHTRDELIEALHHANKSAKRDADTAYYARAHRFINDILDELEEQRGR